MGMILRIASSRIVGQGDIVGRSGYFSLNLSANSVMRGRLDARRTLKSLVADLRLIKKLKLCQSIMQVTQAVKSTVLVKIMRRDDFNLRGEMRLNEQELIVKQAVELSNDG